MGGAVIGGGRRGVGGRRRCVVHRFGPVLLVLAGLLIAAPPAAADVYDVPAGKIAGPPGTVIQVEGLDTDLTTAHAYRVLYRSTLPDGKPIAVSGIVVAPFRKPPAGGWPVVAWAHGTTGVVRKCAPSLLPDPVATIPGIDRMLARGYVVVATDFVGLGADGIHPYLVGESAARAILDSVRAARQFGGGRRYAVWGYSQGGHAALFTGQIAPDYAADLALAGIAAAAPATKLALLFENDLNSLAGRILTAMALRSWSAVYGHPLGGLVKPGAIKTVTAVSAGCVDLVSDGLKMLKEERQMPHAFLEADPTRTRPWSVTIIANTPTRAPKAPVFIAQGSADTVVAPAVTDQFVRQLCRQGARVDFVRYKGATHFDIARKAAEEAMTWIADRFAGKPAPDTCPG
jgi:pimeloyl-ACP methyl ester carboxylesterase